MMSPINPALRREADLAEGLPDREQVRLLDVRQDQVLDVADTDFGEAVFVGEVGDLLHLFGTGVTRNNRRAASGKW